MSSQLGKNNSSWERIIPAGKNTAVGVPAQVMPFCTGYYF
jgi:hypothetical protein